MDRTSNSIGFTEYFTKPAYKKWQEESMVTANIAAHLDDVAATRDQVAFKLLVAELFTLSIVDLHAQFSEMATAQPAVCVAAGGAMLQSLEGVITAKALRQREVICRAVTLASAEVIAADRTATEDEDED